jgi:hypothetical protein
LSASCALVSGLDALTRVECVASCEGGQDAPDGTRYPGASDSAPADAGQLDGAVPTTAVETGTDSGAGDSADAAGWADTLDAVRPEAGGDVWDSGSGEASDGSVADEASDGSVAEGGADAMTLSFTNPLSIDVHAHLDSNTVKTTATGGIVLTPVDGPGGGGRDFPTQAEVAALNGAGTGLPDNAFFLNNGTTIPNVQLAWTNSTNVNNSLVVVGNAGTSEAFAVPPAKYNQLQIYATAGNGSIPLNVTLTYASGNPLAATSALTIPDWCAAPTSLPASVHVLARAGRVKMAVFDPALCNIYAIDLNPDPTRALTQFAFVAQGTATVYLVFYGATAW